MRTDPNHHLNLDNKTKNNPEQNVKVDANQKGDKSETAGLAKKPIENPENNYNFENEKQKDESTTRNGLKSNPTVRDPPPFTPGSMYQEYPPFHHKSKQ